MKRRKYLFILLILLFSILSIFAKTALAQDRTVRVTTLSPNEGEEKDFYLVYGEIVEVTGNISGDVYAFGGQVNIDAEIDGDILAAGGTVNFSGSATNDVTITAGQVVISGSVGENLIVASGDLQFSGEAGVQGGLVAAVGNALIDAPVKGDVKIASGNVVLSNQIGSDTEIWGDSIRLSPNADISGNLTYYSASDLQLSNQASVSGAVSRGMTVADNLDLEQIDFSPLKKSFRNLKTFAKGVGFISALIIGLILIKLFPSCTENTSEMISKNLAKSIFYGLTFLIITPIASILLLITVIGAPISFFVMISYFVLIYLSKLYFSYWLGSKISKNFIKNKYLSFTFGLAIFYLLKFIIVINFFVSLTALVLGLGAAVLGTKDHYKKLLDKKLV